MSTRASRTKKPKVVPNKPYIEKYVTTEQLHGSLTALESSVGKQLDNLFANLFIRQEEMNQMGREHAETQNEKMIVFMQNRHVDTLEVLKKETNTLMAINAAVTGSMNVMQQMPALIKDQSKALWAIRSILGTLVFVVLMTEVVIAIAALALIQLFLR